MSAPAAALPGTAAAGGAQANPLQLTQWLYLAQDLALIAGTGTSTNLSRITVTATTPAGGTGSSPSFAFSTAETLEVAPYADIIATAAVNNSATGCQELAILSGTGGSASSLALVASSGNVGAGVLESTAFTLSSPVQVVIDYLPTSTGATGTQAQMGPLVLAGAAGSTLNLFTLEPSGAGTLSGPWTAPCAPGTVLVGGYFVRYALDAWIVLLGVADGKLSCYALPAAALASAPGTVAEPPAPLAVGTVFAGSPVEACVVQAVPGARGQQLAVAFTPAAGDAAGAPTLALVQLDQGTADSSPALTLVQPPLAMDASKVGTLSGQAVRVAAASFQGTGTDQVVVAVPTTYGGTAGCLALALFAWTASDQAGSTAQRATPPALTQVSEYVCVAPGPAPLTAIDFRIAAGIFWSGGAADGTLGVAVMGCGGSLSELMAGNAVIYAGVVPVSPTGPAFPSPGTGPAVLPAPFSLKVPNTITSFLGLGVDFTGKSVVLGPPTIQQVEQYDQILALLCAPPYDAGAGHSAANPSLSFSEDTTTTSGITVASNRDWTTSTDLSLHLNVGAFSWSNSLNSSYGQNFSLTSDNSVTSGVTINTTISLTDMMLVYGMSYTVWEYPVMQVAHGGITPAGSILVVFPEQSQPIMQLIPAYDPDLTYGYRQPYENGVLPSYVGFIPDGYSLSNPHLEMLFEEVAVTITPEQGSSGIMFTRNMMKTDTTTSSKTVTTNVSDSGGLSLHTALFSYFPASFGMNVGSSSTYSSNNMTTTTLSYSESLSLQVQFGAVKDPSLEYTVTPLIYQHPALGCMVVSYQVMSLGPGWAAAYATARPMLVRPFRDSTDQLLAAFSPSISFPVAGGETGVLVEVFNCGYSAAGDVVCTAYAGVPDTSGSTPGAPSGGTVIGTATLSLQSLQRATATIPWASAQSGQAVTVVVESAGNIADIGWSAYPPSAAGGFVAAGR